MGHLPHELAKTGQLRQNEAMMKRLFLVFSLVAILTAVCGVHAYVPNPAKAYSFENAETLVPRSLSGRIICRNDPINKFDPDGRRTAIIITSEMYGPFLIGHATLHVDNGGNGSPLMYDPQGGYKDGQNSENGSGFIEPARSPDDILTGADANLDNFQTHYYNEDNKVSVSFFNTTPEEEAKIAENASTIGHPGCPIGCANAVGTAIGGVGPFKDIPFILTPFQLKIVVAGLQAKKTSEEVTKNKDEQKE